MRGKTGGGLGTNQYKIKGSAKQRPHPNQPTLVIPNDLENPPASLLRPPPWIGNMLVQTIGTAAIVVGSLLVSRGDTWWIASIGVLSCLVTGQAKWSAYRKTVADAKRLDALKEFHASWAQEHGYEEIIAPIHRIATAIRSLHNASAEKVRDAHSVIYGSILAILQTDCGPIRHGGFYRVDHRGIKPTGLLFGTATTLTTPQKWPTVLEGVRSGKDTIQLDDSAGSLLAIPIYTADKITMILIADHPPENIWTEKQRNIASICGDYVSLANTQLLSNKKRHRPPYPRSDKTDGKIRYI